MREDRSKELESNRQIRAEFEARQDREQTERRLSYLKDIGADGAVIKDEYLARLCPPVDVTTAEGRAKIDKWRQENPGLFVGGGVNYASPEELASGLPESKFGTFDRNLALRMLRKEKGRG